MPWARRFVTTFVALPLSITMAMTKPASKVSMHWFRRGLRLHDNPALLAALDDAPSEVYPVYILDGDCYQLQRCTALRANFLVECLQDLDQNLRKVGSRLYVARGDPVTVLPELWKKWGVTHMTYEEEESGEPYARKRDEAVLQSALQLGVQVDGFAQETLHPLKAYFRKAGQNIPITMGTFQKLFDTMGSLPQPKNAPKESNFPRQSHDEANHFPPPKKATDLPWPRSVPKEKVTPIWGPEDCENLTPVVRGGESKALHQLQRKMQNASWVATFEKPQTSCTYLEPSTTALSPYMSLGCLSPRTFWFAIDEACKRSSKAASKPPVSLHGQLLWRDFNNLMAASANSKQPGCWNMMEGNMYCRQIPWSENEVFMEAWANGQTGYPWIDACMMQLKKEGWIHHLGRHAVACFLTRGDLWQSWERGAEHFESHLLDADYALNGFNWMWLSCSGFFYQYFRCYSPISFQKKNDPHGLYIRKYLPLLKKLPDQYIYEPWKAPLPVQNTAGVVIGKHYPAPIVDHALVSKENMSKMAYAYDQSKDKSTEKSARTTRDPFKSKKRKVGS